VNLTSIHQQLLEAAANYIEKHPPNGVSRFEQAMMVAAIRSKAGGASTKTRHASLPQVKETAPKVVASKRTSKAITSTEAAASEENARLLLRTAGLQKIHTITLRVYLWMLQHQARARSLSYIKNALTIPGERPVRDILWKLVKRDLLEKTADGLYRIKETKYE
jgi:hypothetical protein